MTIKELVNKYLNDNYSLRDAQNLAAEEIMIKKISSSDLAEHITLKGGIVMFNLTKNSRRVTQDIDFDLIRYSLDKESISLFIKKMNNSKDGISVSIKGEIEDLNQDDYKGVRVNVVFHDSSSSLKLKLDIGVHTYSAIEQKSIIFNFENNSSGLLLKANPPEQIFAEKLLSLARHGAISTRYKDLYDFYYLIKECSISPKRVSEVLALFFKNTNKRPKDIYELQTAIEDTLNNNSFAREASKPASKWIDAGFDDVKKTIIDFVYKF